MAARHKKRSIQWPFTHKVAHIIFSFFPSLSAATSSFDWLTPLPAVGQKSIDCVVVEKFLLGGGDAPGIRCGEDELFSSQKTPFVPSFSPFIFLWRWGEKKQSSLPQSVLKPPMNLAIHRDWLGFIFPNSDYIWPQNAENFSGHLAHGVVPKYFVPTSSVCIDYATPGPRRHQKAPAGPLLRVHPPLFSVVFIW